MRRPWGKPNSSPCGLCIAANSVNIERGIPLWKGGGATRDILKTFSEPVLVIRAATKTGLGLLTGLGRLCLVNSYLKDSWLCLASEKGETALSRKPKYADGPSAPRTHVFTQTIPRTRKCYLSPENPTSCHLSTSLLIRLSNEQTRIATPTCWGGDSFKLFHRN